jgi:prepilin-type N-terminal cleavage/methylation domain-containing protein
MKKAFTLAEVLITLGIIGVVAALTMPGLIVNYQKQQTVTQLKRAYSALDQAVKLASLDHETFEYKGSSVAAREAYLEEYFLPYLKTVQICAPVAECGINYLDYKYLNGQPTSSTVGIDANSVAVVLPDGNVFIIGATSSNAQVGSYYAVLLDINGKKGPNVMGKDLFRLTSTSFITSQGFGLAFSSGDREALIGEDGGVNGNGCNINSTGKNCFSLIMHDGWEIRDDYPFL